MHRARPRLHAKCRSGGSVNVNLNVALAGQADLMFIAPTYTFAMPVLGSQLSATLASVHGRNSANISGTLTATAGPTVTSRNGFLEDALTSYGDLYPPLKLKWNNGVHNTMIYAAGEIPTGDYNSNRLTNIGIGHGAIDFGGGYTYLNPTTGTEFSGVGGITYNFKNPDTQYQSGVDFHFDWGVSQFLSKQVFVGFVGYAYQQITDDSGQAAVLGGIGEVSGYAPQAAAEKLIAGEIDAAFIVTGWESPVVQSLLNTRGIEADSFRRADAFIAIFPFLHKLVLPAGVVDLAANVPPADVVLVAPKASLPYVRTSTRRYSSCCSMLPFKSIPSPGFLRRQANSLQPNRSISRSVPRRSASTNPGGHFYRDISRFGATLVEQTLVVLSPWLRCCIPYPRCCPRPTTG
jgi:hypothetical protein